MKSKIILAIAALGLIGVLGVSQETVKSPHGKMVKWDCQNCHSLDSWTQLKDSLEFNHDKTSFPLKGSHRSVKCAQCHTNLDFRKASQACVDCHNDVHRDQFGTSCQNCHTSESWKDSRDILDQHAQHGFSLTSVHAITDCAKCHVNSVQNEYAGAPHECRGCHSEDFNSTRDPNHIQAGFSSDCESCHQIASAGWTQTSYTHTDAFPLTGGHGGLDCNGCHSSSYKGTSKNCYSCHQSTFAGVRDPNHISGNFDHDCTKCHTTMAWLPATFDHAATAFALTGAHAKTACQSCHKTGYTNTSTACYACHQQSFAAALDPNHPSGGFSHECTICHTTTAWSPATFDHSKSRFPLVGAHQQVACANCHTSGYAGTATDCYSCHQTRFAAVTDPNHVSNNFDHDCTKCHTMNAWTPSTFDHKATLFPLTGAHSSVSCVSCHTTGYAGTPTTCYSCHQTQFASVTDPNHVSNNFDHDCTKCHTTTAWNPSTFDHKTTLFPLTGAHSSVSCVSCHTTGYAGTPTACYSCHQTQFTSVVDPNHVSNNFDHDCTKCHTTTTWNPSTFDHKTTLFPLTGAHSSVSCVSCHTTGYAGTPTTCYSCHQTQFTSVTDPNHVTNNFDHDCTKCHGTSAWLPSTFGHNATAFPLTGAHATATCKSCHITGYAGTPSTCYGCHQTQFTSVTDPNHVTSNFDHDCTKCHTTTAWNPSTFDHKTTLFPLTGAHVAVTCKSCHITGFAGTPTACYSCHQTQFTSVADPNHVTNNFDHDCTKCHGTSAWLPSTFGHNATAFPLTGAHATATCKSCHITGYAGTPSTCYGCHQTQFTSVVDPNHVANNFDQNCTKCHSTSAWLPSTFGHNATLFPLTGAHVAVACKSCHITGYAGTPNTCYGCHQARFTSVVDPNHVANNFDHDCTKCHSTTAWNPSTFNHSTTLFPLSGAHTIVACVSCHATGYTGTSTACYSCHQTEYSTVIDPNHVSNNFDHVCTKCHSTAAWTPATFDHRTTAFPLTGAHLTATCIACHRTGYVGTTTSCYACHQTSYASATSPNHASQVFPTDCKTCHSTTGWTPATWDHDGKYFPIYTGRHSTVWNTCTTCHNVVGNFAAFECINCHTHSKSVTDSHHTGQAGYQYTSAACFRCHPRGRV